MDSSEDDGMDIRNSRQNILPAGEVAALCRRSDASGLRQFILHIGALLLAAWVVQMTVGSWWLLPAMLVQGLIQVGLFATLHETVHRTAFRRRRLNDLVAVLTGLILMLPATYYRRFHFAHHRHTQDPDHDPEMTVAKPTTLSGYFMYLTAYVYWRERIRELLQHARGRVDAPFIPKGERTQVVREARWHLAVYAGAAALVLFGVSDVPLYNWLLPALLGQPFLRAYLLAEHTGCAENNDMLANTRTTRSVGPVRWLMWNMPFHTEHHVFPAVPFHALPALHRLMRAHLVDPSPGYTDFHRRYRKAIRDGRGGDFVHPTADNAT